MTQNNRLIFGDNRFRLSGRAFGWCMLFITFFVAGLTARYIFLKASFTHIDDIGVAWTLVAERYFENPNFSECSFANFWENVTCKFSQRLDTVETFEASKTDLNLKVAALNLKQLLKSLLVPIYEFHEIPARWTYAPGQYYITQFLVHSDLMYAQIKSLGRLPSFLFSVVALVLQVCVHTCATNITNKKLTAALLALIIAAFSWESIFYSAHMSNFAAAQMCVALLGITLFRIVQHQAPPPSFSVAKLGALLIAVALLSYQSVFFIPAFLFTLFVLEPNRKWLMAYKLLKVSIIFGVCFSPFFYLFLLSHLKSNAGIGWNAGPFDEFVFTGSVYVFSDVFLGLLKFSALFPTVIEAMVTPTTFGGSLSPLFSLLLTTFFVIGVLSCIQKGDRQKLAAVIFFFVSIVTWFVLWILGAISFGPTRHSLVWSFFFIYFIVMGIDFLLAVVKQSIWRSSLVASICVLWTLTFFNSASFYIEARRDYYDEAFIARKFQTLDVDIIISDMKNSASFMPQVRADFPIVADKVAPEKIVYKLNNINEIDVEYIRVGLIGLSECFPSTTTNPDLFVQAVEQTLGLHLNNARAKSHKVLFHVTEVFDVEVEWSGATNNGKNDYCLKVIEI